MSDKRCPFDHTPLTTNSGAPVVDNQNSMTAGKRGPLLAQDVWLNEKLANFVREVIPERRMHAKGSGAFGTFTVTNDISKYSCEKIFSEVGKKTEMFARFSTVAGERGAADAERDIRGFALKFYTDEGNWDLVGNNTPVFFLNDPMKFPDFIHSQKKNPRTNLPDPSAVFEYWANHPQSLHQMTILMSDRGIPKSLRHTNGYGSHTFSLWNNNGERFWVKWHFKTDQGVETLTNDEAATMDPAGAQKDLVEAIDQGNFPSWTVKVQIMSEADAKDFPVNPFDLTKVWPHELVPLQEIGTLELNRNVDNYFAETEQACFAPNNLVPGIGASPDKMLQGRLLAYQDAHRYRVGVNANQLPVNAAKCPVNHYQRDGAMAGMCPAHGAAAVQTSRVNYYPNDQINDGAPVPNPAVAEPPMPVLESAWVARHGLADDEDHYTQAGDLFRLMNDSQKGQLTTTIAGGLVHASESAQQRMLAQFVQADSDYAARIVSAMETMR